MIKIDDQKIQSKEGSLGELSQVKGISQKRYDDQIQNESRLSQIIIQRHDNNTPIKNIPV